MGFVHDDFQPVKKNKFGPGFRLGACHGSVNDFGQNRIIFYLVCCIIALIIIIYL